MDKKDDKKFFQILEPVGKSVSPYHIYVSAKTKN